MLAFDERFETYSATEQVVDLRILADWEEVQERDKRRANDRAADAGRRLRTQQAAAFANSGLSKKPSNRRDVPAAGP